MCMKLRKFASAYVYKKNSKHIATIILITCVQFNIGVLTRKSTCIYHNLSVNDVHVFSLEN